jgi:hypothetical protein
MSLHLCEVHMFVALRASLIIVCIYLARKFERFRHCIYYMQCNLVQLIQITGSGCLVSVMEKISGHFKSIHTDN